MNGRPLLRLHKIFTSKSSSVLFANVKKNSRGLSGSCTRFNLSSSSTRASKSTFPSAWLNESSKRLVIKINGIEEEFPWVWLRDSCQCAQCHEPISSCRIINLTEWNLSVRPTELKYVDDALELTWEDGHQSYFTIDWLAKRSFRQENRLRLRERITSTQQLWGRELMDKIPNADYNQVMEDDRALLSWLEDLDKFGFVLIKNAPVREGPVPALQERIAFEKMTHYGPGYTVVVRPDPANISHTHHRIFFHTDLTYYDYMPGTIFLHCIEQHEGKGGETMLTDGFHAAAKLKEKQPDMYKLLAETVTSFRDVGTDYTKFDKITEFPFLVHNARGKLSRINWSHFARDTHLDADIDLVEDIYKAMRTFDDLMNDEENHIRLKMKPGDMVTVKNQRVLHGRSELEGGVSGRHLQCGYMDWDEIRSTMRVTRAKLDCLN